MHIGEFINQYLMKKRISQRQFAKDCGLSNGYISMLINNVNPKTGKPLVPSLTTLISISRGMGITVDDLIAQTDDITVDISLAKNLSSVKNKKETPSGDISEGERLWNEMYHRISDDTKRIIIMMADKLEGLSEDQRKMFLLNFGGLKNQEEA